MSVTGSRRLLSVVAFIAAALAAGSVQAQTRAETLRYVTGEPSWNLASLRRRNVIFNPSGLTS